jgi:hypothetical protein
MDNHIKKIEKLIRKGRIPAGRVSDVIVEHDSWCGINRGGRCNCDPIIRLQPRPQHGPASRVLIDIPRLSSRR